MSVPFITLQKSKFTFPNKPLYPSNKPAYFYDGQLIGDMADFSAQCMEPHWGSPDYAEEEFDDVPF